MAPAIKLRWYYSICIAFVILQSIAVILDYPWVGLLPLALIVVFLVVFKLDKLLLILNFLIPISINIPDVGFGLGISLPDEPLIIGIMMLTVFKFIIDAQYDYKVFRHPVTIAIALNILWLVVTTCTSQYPFISFKFVISRFWYIVVFYFLAIMFFRDWKNISLYLWACIIPLFGVIAFTIYKHSFNDFSLARSYTVMHPFYIDHGVYAAAISLFVPVLVCWVLFYRKMGLNAFTVTITAIVLVTFLAGIYFSYTRAAWIGIMAAIGFIVPVLLRIRLNTVLIVGIGVITTAFIFQDQILYIMGKNEQKSAQGFFKHFQSISNIKTDPSNTERINRWMCAISMFEEKPVLGFGPGTYSFCYAPYQQSRYITEISTNFGDGGNAHSEYLNPLAETGVLGLLTYLLIVYLAMNTGLRLYYTADDAKVRLLSLSVVLALITYYTHGFLNDYIESDKTAPMTWGGFAILTALDLYHRKSEKEEV